MQSFFVAWRFLLMFSIFAFTQLLGILLYFRLGRAPRWAAAIIGILAPCIFFFWLAPIFLFSGIREAYARGEITCGLPAMAATLMLFSATIIQVLLSLIIQGALSARRKMQPTRGATDSM